MGKQIYPEIVTGALIEENGRILLFRNRKLGGKFTVAGGHIEFRGDI